MTPYILAVLACCLAGAMGGYALVRPRETLQDFGLTVTGERAGALDAMRAAGGLLLLAHGGTAATLGYAPTLGAAMALTLALAWAGAVAGRLSGLIRGGERDARGLSTIVFEALMAITLALPYWAATRAAAGPAIAI